MIKFIEIFALVLIGAVMAYAFLGMI